MAITYYTDKYKELAKRQLRFVGRFGFELAKPRELPMLVMKGKLGLFEVAYQLPEGEGA